MTEITQVSDAAVLGECPLWSGAEQVLYWTDIEGRKLHRLDPAGGSTTHDMPGRVGSFAITSEPGRLLVAMEDDLQYFDWDTGALEHFATIEEPSRGNRLNDGRCDAVGRYIVGTMWPNGGDGRRTGSLYQVETDGSFRILETDVGVPNALVFDEERGRMYWADTHTEVIWVWDYDLDTGERHNKRLFYDMTDEPGLPDGGCLDADGCVWSAAVYGWELMRFTPDGEVDRRIPMPVQKPSMPAFGGADLSTLYVTTIGAGGNVPSDPPRGDYDSGALFAIDAGVQGIPEPVFGA